ncbi:MAG: hypothetical protein ACOY31_09545 [Bacillota bacterium]
MNGTGGKDPDRSLERLTAKLERLYEQQIAENEKTERMAKSLDNVARMLSSLESNRSFELEFNNRIEQLNKSIERIVAIKESDLKDAEEKKNKLNSIIQGIVVLGQILSALAVGIQMAVDSVSNVLNKNAAEKATGPDKKQNAGARVEMAMLIPQLSSLVSNMVEEKKQRQVSSISREKKDILAKEEQEEADRAKC